jgi:hypothetical protein
MFWPFIPIRNHKSLVSFCIKSAIWKPVWLSRYIYIFIAAIPLCLTIQVIYSVETQHTHIVHQYTKGDMFRFLMNHPQANTNHVDIVL